MRRPRVLFNTDLATDAQEAQDDATAHTELLQLLNLLPPAVRNAAMARPDIGSLVEIVMDVGRYPVARFPAYELRLSEDAVDYADLEYATRQVGDFQADNRAGISRTLHRISCIRNRHGRIVGLTCRVGRSIRGSAALALDLLQDSSILLLGPPGSGKTTALREMSRVLADVMHRRTVIVDTSNEIGGDGDIPHAGIGRARRMQVYDTHAQHKVMIEAVENHTPNCIIIDEIGSEQEALAARTIAQRGVQLIATAHGNYLEDLIKNPSLTDLVGGIASVTLSDEEAKRRGVQKSILERKEPPTFQVVVEMRERGRWNVHLDSAQAVDLLLAGKVPKAECRVLGPDGTVRLSYEDLDERPSTSKSGLLGSGTNPLGLPKFERPAAPTAASARAPPPLTPEEMRRDMLRQLAEQQIAATSGRTPFSAARTASAPSRRAAVDEDSDEEEDEDAEEYDQDEDAEEGNEEASREGPTRVFLHDVSKEDVRRVIRGMSIRGLVRIVRSLEDADAVLAPRSSLKNSVSLKSQARALNIPIYSLRTDSQISLIKAIRTLLGFDPSPSSSISSVDEGAASATSAASAASDGSDSDGESAVAALPARPQQTGPPPTPGAPTRSRITSDAELREAMEMPDASAARRAGPRVSQPPPRATSYLEDAVRVTQVAAAEGEDGPARGGRAGPADERSRIAPRTIEESLKEARFALEEVVMRRNQPIDLSPRPSELLTLQIELVTSYRLGYQVVGSGDGKQMQRLRIFPPGATAPASVASGPAGISSGGSGAASLD